VLKAYAVLIVKALSRDSFRLEVIQQTMEPIQEMQQPLIPPPQITQPPAMELQEYQITAQLITVLQFLMLYPKKL